MMVSWHGGMVRCVNLFSVANDCHQIEANLFLRISSSSTQHHRTHTRSTPKSDSYVTVVAVPCHTSFDVRTNFFQPITPRTAAPPRIGTSSRMSNQGNFLVGELIACNCNDRNCFKLLGEDTGFQRSHSIFFAWIRQISRRKCSGEWGEKTGAGLLSGACQQLSYEN